MTTQVFEFRLGQNLMRWTVDGSDPGEVDCIFDILNLTREGMRSQFVPKFWSGLRSRGDYVRGRETPLP